MAEWKEIASAPKDGTVVLLWLKSDIDRYYVSPESASRICLGFCGSSNPDYGQYGWCSVEAKEEMWGMGGEMTGPMMSTDCIPVDPSHWMPLPPAPSQKEQG